MAQAAGKYGEHAPMATVCCNACRTCVQTNGIALLLGGAAAASAELLCLATCVFELGAGVGVDELAGLDSLEPVSF